MFQNILILIQKFRQSYNFTKYFLITRKKKMGRKKVLYTSNNYKNIKKKLKNKCRNTTMRKKKVLTKTDATVSRSPTTEYKKIKFQINQ